MENIYILDLIGLKYLFNKIYGIDGKNMGLFYSTPSKICLVTKSLIKSIYDIHKYYQSKY